MTARNAAERAAGAEGWRGLAAIGAERAALTLATLAGSPVEVGPLRADPALKPPAETGVLFDVGGRVNGRLGLFLDAPTRRSLVRLLLDEEEPEAPAEMVASALCELGNIMASQAVSAIADALGAGITLSVPQLVLERAGAVFAAAGSSRGAAALVFATELAAPGAELCVLLVLAPDAQGPAA
jgi:chemotaxis protein CheY-P-specific phosphatase CheC